jgi:hypothetical protein
MAGTVLIIFGGIILVGNLILRFVNLPPAAVPDFIRDLSLDLVKELKNKFLNLYFYEGIAMAVLGFGCWFASFFIKSAPPVVKNG